MSANPTLERTPRLSRRFADPESGSVMWTVLVAVGLLMLGAVFASTVVTTVQRSKAATDATVLTQYTDTAVADAITKLNDGEPVPTSLADTTPTCDTIDKRVVCYRTWAMPVPGTATDPVRYDVLARVWVDTGDRTEPASGLNVRSAKVPVEVVTYQTAPGTEPQLVAGPVNGVPAHVAYHPTPGGLFANAIASLTTTTLEGPDVAVRSYNSQTGTTGTRNGTVAATGQVVYGSGTDVDQTLILNGAAAGNHISRCTGESCEESPVRVVEATYITPAGPDDPGVAWIGDATTGGCVPTAGDWVASDHGGQLPPGKLCVNGSLIIDTPTTLAGVSSTVYVRGAVHIADNLAAPAHGDLPSPARLVIITDGAGVMFDTPAGASVSALIYAPVASCGTNPGRTDALNYYGSLVCKTVSVGGGWNHMYDDAATAEFADPVPGARKSFSPGAPAPVGFDEFHAPIGWDTEVCPYAVPEGATGYWKLDERTGQKARDNALAAGDGRWASATAAARTDGVCGLAAVGMPAGAVTNTAAVTMSGADGFTIEYWGKDLDGVAVSSGGVTVRHDKATRHVFVTVGDRAEQKIPVTVQHWGDWHHYVVRIDTGGTARLHVDGGYKQGATGPVVDSAGPLTIGAGTGVIDEVVVYGTDMGAAYPGQRFAWWMDNRVATTVIVPHPGDPFTAPTGLADNGSDGTALRLRWVAPTGTFPHDDTPPAHYRVQRMESGSWAWYGDPVPGDQSTFTESDPDPLGTFDYRVCAEYNTDRRCSAAVAVNTSPLPLDTVLTGHASTATTTGGQFTWTTSENATSYEFQWQIDGGPWTSAALGDVLERTVTDAPPGTRIHARVRGVNLSGVGPWSNTALLNTKPEVPTLTAGSITTTGGTFSWTAAAGAGNGYELQWRVNGGSWTSASHPSSYSRAITATSGALVEGRVRAVASTTRVGDWSPTVPMQLQPAAPSLSTTNTTETSTTFTWTEPSGNINGYQFDWRFPLSDDEWRGPTTLSASTTSRTVSATQGHQIVGRVRARIGSTWGPWSNVVTAQTIPASPTLSITARSNTTARCSWNTPRGMTSYTLQYRVNTGSWQTLTGTGTYRDITQREGDRIDCRVRAHAGSTLSPYSGVEWVRLNVRAPAGQMNPVPVSEKPSTNILRTRIDNITCPAGTTVQYRHQGRWNSDAWPGFGSWQTSSFNYRTDNITASTQYYYNVRHWSVRVRCYNPDSGAAGPESGSIVSQGRHPIPAPTGLTLTVGGTGSTYRAAEWGASCVAGTVPRYGITIRAATFTYGVSRTASTRYERTNEAWGSGTATVAAVCMAQGQGNQFDSPQVSRSRNF